MCNIGVRNGDVKRAHIVHPEASQACKDGNCANFPDTSLYTLFDTNKSDRDIEVFKAGFASICEKSSGSNAGLQTLRSQ